MVSKLEKVQHCLTLLDNVSHPMHEAATELESLFSCRPLHPGRTEKRYQISLLPTSLINVYILAVFCTFYSNSS